uniref:exodeoxyribonuclease III n=1 Tax=Micrurus lemniscatus lemniscatus TaxID=129467 RepID=A0A2D4IZL8_MICLE
MGDRTLMLLNTNGLASQLKRHRIMRLAKDCKADFLFLTETHKGRKRSDKLVNNSEWKWIYESRGNTKSRGVAILIHQRVPFELIQIRRDKEGRMLFIKGKINYKMITFAVVYAPNANTKQFIINVKRKLDNFAEGAVILAGDFNIELTARKGEKKKMHLNKLNMMDLHADVTNRGTFYSARYNKFSCIDYILMNKTGNIYLKRAETKYLDIRSCSIDSGVRHRF